MKKLLTLSLLSIALFLAACGKEGYENKNEMSAGTSKEEVQEQLGQTPSAENSESNTETTTYEDMEYCGHKGTMTYYYSNDALTLSQWDSTADNKEDALEIYDDLKNKLTDEYGDGSQGGDENSYCWYTDEKQISLSCTDADGKYKVSVVEYDCSGSTDGASE